MPAVCYTEFAHYKATQGAPKRLSLQAFANLCATSYAAKKQQPLCVPDKLPGNSRASGNEATAATAIFLDFDKTQLSMSEAAAKLDQYEADCVFYPTYGWTAAAPKYRAVLTLARPVPLEQRKDLIARIETVLPGIAPESYDDKRGYFVGRNGRDGVPPPIVRKGKPADRIAWPEAAAAPAAKPAGERKGEPADVAKKLVKKLGRKLQDKEGRWSAVEYLATRVSARAYTEEECYALLNTLIETYFDPDHITDEDRQKWESRIAYWLARDKPKKEQRAAAVIEPWAEWDIEPRRDVLNPDAAPLPRFAPGLFPKVIDELALSCKLDPLPTALLATAACGTAIGAQVYLQTQTWQFVYSVMHLFVHGIPSAGKTAIFSATMRPLEVMQDEIIRRNAACLLEYIEKKKKNEPVTLRKEPLLYASDITGASMVDCLEGHSHGLALINDEARGMLTALSSVNNNAREDRSALLALRDGKARTIVRRSRHGGLPASCPRWIGNVMIAAPTRVAEEVMLKNKDGLLSRFTMVYQEPTPVAEPSAEAARCAGAYEKLLRELHGNRLPGDHCLELGKPALEVLLDGQHAYRATALKIAADDEDMAERFGKAAQDAASIALIIACIESGEEQDRLAAPGIMRRSFRAPDARQMERAFQITDLTLRFNEAFCWRGVKNRPGLELAQHLARFIVRSDFAEFTTRDISRTVDKWNSAEERNVGLRDSIRRTALEILIDDGWIQADQPGWLIGDKLRRGVTWLVNPAVRAMTDERAAERKRKDDTAQAIARSAEARRREQ